MDNKLMHAKYFCNCCDFKCSKLSNYNAHLITRKHLLRVNDKIIMQKNALYKCENCDKEYKFLSGLSRHKKTCKLNNIISENSEKESIENSGINNISKISAEVILQLIKENSEIKELLYKQSEKIEEQNKQINSIIPNMKKVTNVTNTTINNNQKFNINLFLNEKCKYALNMSDFIKSIEISLEQMDLTKTKGLSAHTLTI